MSTALVAVVSAVLGVGAYAWRRLLHSDVPVVGLGVIALGVLPAVVPGLLESLRRGARSAWNPRASAVALVSSTLSYAAALALCSLEGG